MQGLELLALHGWPRLPVGPEELTDSNHFPVSSALIVHPFGIVQVFPQDYSPFQRCQLGRFCVQGPTVHPPRRLEVQSVWDSCACRAVATHPCRGSRDTHAPCQGPGYSWGTTQDVLVATRPGWKGDGAHRQFFPRSLEELAAAPEVLSLQQGGGEGEGETVRGEFFLLHVPRGCAASQTTASSFTAGRRGVPPHPLSSLCLTLPVPTGVPEPRVHPCHHEADVLPTLPGHVQREALQQLLPECGEGLPGQPGRSQHRVEVPDG